MEYQLYQFRFSSGVHFGSGSLDQSEYTFCADTLFSALCQAAIRLGQETLETLVEFAEEGSLLFSDAFPYMKEELFLPKPIMHVERTEKEARDSSVKKAYKKMKYVPVSDFDAYLKGNFSVEKAEALDQFGAYQMKTSAAVRGLEESMPYRVRTFRFREGNGLYIICGYQEKDRKELLEDLMEYLMLDGLGGKRSSGLGRFECVPVKMNGILAKRLEETFSRYMTLSISLPQFQELDEVLKDADYLLQKRSGFVASSQYSAEWMRKKDAYLFAAGSCFSRSYRGCILDVSSGGLHPVYRYAKPFFMGVSL